ncbi:MAG: DUF1153 domain-containing protein [Erythrobacter sp.]|uniref:DUF1153 domain-containing protein n=1 Tax=Erythrobacter sp. Alg231-14 TaxID=1922225 RepID=UPI000D550872
MAYPRDISIADAIKRYGLPKSHKVHWSATRKADVVRAVHDRAISFHEARDRYLLSRSEFEEWEREYNVTSRAGINHMPSMEDA